jgi:4-hydroxybenzoate polyprenyltransferase
LDRTPKNQASEGEKSMAGENRVGVNEVLGSINRGVMGHGAFPATERWRKLTFLESLIEITRPFLVIMGVPTAGIGAFLAPGRLPSPLILAVGVLACMLSAAGMHAFNDWVDRERDRRIWPNRPIPAGRFPVALALIYGLFLMGLSVGITWIFYNPTAGVILGIVDTLGILFCLSLKNSVGHLSLPFVIALIPVVGWAAISPETLFSRILPWVLSAIVFTWQAGHVMASALVHPIREDENGVLRCERKAAFFFPTPKQAALLALFFVSLLFLQSLLLPVTVGLGVFYWCLALPAGILSVGTAVWLLLDPTKQQRAIFAFNAASMFLAFLCGGAVLDVIFKKHLSAFLAWAVSVANSLIAAVEQGSATVERSIYVIGLVVTIAVVLFSTGGMLRGIVKAREARETRESPDF